MFDDAKLGEFIETQMEENNGEITPQNASRMLEMALQGDTAMADTMPKADSSESPATTDPQDVDKNPVPDAQANESKGDKPTDTTPNESTADTAVLLAKDGKHTIPFEKLQEARDGEKHWKAQFELLQAQQAQQQAQMQQQLQQQLLQNAQNASNPNTAAPSASEQAQLAQQAIDAGIDPKVFGSFDENDIAKGLTTVLNDFRQEIDRQVNEKVQAHLQPLQQQQALTGEKAHFTAIYDAHPDIDSILESQEFDSWMQSQPSYSQLAINAVLQQGTAAQIIEVFNQFKDINKPSTPSDNNTQTAESLKATAQKAIDNAKPAIPNSLTDLQGGRIDATNPDEKVASMGSVAMLNEMTNWSPEKIDRYLNGL